MELPDTEFAMLSGHRADLSPGYMNERLARWRRATDTPLLILAIGSLPLLLLDLQSDLPRSDTVFLWVVNLLVLVAFAIDYLVELHLASNRRVYVRCEWTSLVIVLSQALALLPVLGGLGALRALRGTRALRAMLTLGRVFAIGGIASREGRSIIREKAAVFALGTAGLTWITSAVGFTLAEDVGTGGRLTSFFDAVWWSSATITTVGYGDVYPITTTGRLVGMVTMVVGISTFAVVTARVAAFLASNDAGRADGRSGVR